MMSAVYSRRASNRRTASARRRSDRAETETKSQAGAWREPPSKLDLSKVATGSIRPSRTARPRITRSASPAAVAAADARPAAAASAATVPAEPARPSPVAVLAARHDPASRLARDLRPIGQALVARALATAAAPRDRVVLVTSPNAGDGKTFVTVELALALALDAARRVLLIDAAGLGPAARRPDSLATRLGLTETAGLAEALTTPELDPVALVQPTDLDRLALLGPGRTDRPAPELLAAGRLPPVVQALRQSDPERLILIDGPTLLAGVAARVLALVAGQVLLVAAAGRTDLDGLAACRRLLAEHAGVGVVLNRTSALAASAPRPPPARPAEPAPG